jgi:hypothetical protein
MRKTANRKQKQQKPEAERYTRAELIEIHTRRLKAFVKLMRRVAKRKLADQDTLRETGKGRAFRMQEWARHFGEHAPTPKHNFCGTAACAAGWAALHPPFNKEGLGMGWKKDTGGYGDMPPQWEGFITFEDYDDDDSSSAAACAFFGLNGSDEATDVFGYQNPNDPNVIANKLEKYITDRNELDEFEEEKRDALETLERIETHADDLTTRLSALKFERKLTLRRLKGLGVTPD